MIFAVGLRRALSSGPYVRIDRTSDLPSVKCGLINLSPSFLAVISHLYTICSSSHSVLAFSLLTSCFAPLPCCLMRHALRWSLFRDQPGGHTTMRIHEKMRKGRAREKLRLDLWIIRRLLLLPEPGSPWLGARLAYHEVCPSCHSSRACRPGPEMGLQMRRSLQGPMSRTVQYRRRQGCRISASCPGVLPATASRRGLASFWNGTLTPRAALLRPHVGRRHTIALVASSAHYCWSTRLFLFRFLVASARRAARPLSRWGENQGR